MKFEDLANEVLIEIFERIDFIALFRAFYDLNQRLNRLIFVPYRDYRLHFRSISKREFDLICQCHLSTIASGVVSLSLSNNDQTPTLVDHFLFSGFGLHQFSRLRSLTLDSIHSLSTLNRLVSQCRNLRCFTHLSLRRCHFHHQPDFSILLTTIWQLSKLIHCTIDHPLPYKLKFFHHSIVSPAMESLSMEKYQFDLSDLSNLFHCTPSLRYFSGTIKSSANSGQAPFLASAIVSLRLVSRSSVQSLIVVLQAVPNLKHLAIQTKDLYLHGHEWKKIIRTHTPKLEELQMKMDFKLFHSSYIEQQLEDLLASFSSSFWIEQHDWFVRCDWMSSTLSHFGTLYTIPYAFDDFLLVNRHWSKSTSISERECIQAHKLTMVNMRTFPHNDDTSTRTYELPNLSHLKLHLPLTSTFWSLAQSFNRLSTLEVMLFEGCSYAPLQTLLDHSPLLSSLCLGNFNTLKLIGALKSASISRLDFITRNNYKRYCDRTQCDIVAASSLGQRCEVLLINLENRESLLHLLRRMSKLRSVIFQCKDDRGDEEILQWLDVALPSTYSIQRDELHPAQIRLWLA